MIYGRIIGIFTAVVLTGLFPVDEPLFRGILWAAFTAIGLLVSIIASLILGINFNTDQPTDKDSPTYWTEKYGEDMGKAAYELYVKNLK